jgi:hypothetical protein
MTGIQVSIDDVTVEAGQDMYVLAQVDNTFGDVDYDRYIDGVSLDGISTQ